MQIFKAISKSVVVGCLLLLNCGAPEGVNLDERAAGAPQAEAAQSAASESGAQSVEKQPAADATQRPLCGWGCVQACNKCLAKHTPEYCDPQCNCNDPENCCPGGRCS